MKQLRDVLPREQREMAYAIGETGYVFTEEWLDEYLQHWPVLTLNGCRDNVATLALREAVRGMPRNEASSMHFIADWVEAYARENIG